MHGDRPVHPSDQLAADVQPEAASSDARQHVRVGAIELLEDATLGVAGDAEPLVGDLDPHDAVVLRQPNVHRSAAGRVLDRVVDEVHEHLP